MVGLKSDLNGFGGISKNVSITISNTVTRIRHNAICLFIFWLCFRGPYRGPQLGGHYMIIDGSEHNWIPSCKPVFEQEIVIQSYNPSYP